MSIWAAILLSVGLCADCFAVAVCSGVTMRRRAAAAVFSAALVFAAVHICFLTAGWLLGSLILGMVGRLARWVGFFLLLYVGVVMLFEGIRGKEEVKLLDSPLHIFIAAVATSIDALAAGAAQSMEATPFTGVLPLVVSLFVITMITVSAGIAGGKALKNSIGRWAEIAGGLVLVAIGVTVLF